MLCVRSYGLGGVGTWAPGVLYVGCWVVPIRGVGRLACWAFRVLGVLCVGARACWAFSVVSCWGVWGLWVLVVLGVGRVGVV